MVFVQYGFAFQFSNPRFVLSVEFSRIVCKFQNNKSSADRDREERLLVQRWEDWKLTSSTKKLGTRRTTRLTARSRNKVLTTRRATNEKYNRNTLRPRYYLDMYRTGNHALARPSGSPTPTSRTCGLLPFLLSKGNRLAISPNNPFCAPWSSGLGNNKRTAKQKVTIPLTRNKQSRKAESR